MCQPRDKSYKISPLNELERRKILEEERLRRSLREEFDNEQSQKKKPSRYERLTDFLNSNFGMWILGTIFLGTITSGWAFVSSSLDELNNDDREQGKILSELIFRVEEVDLILNYSGEHPEIEKDISSLGWNSQPTEYPSTNTEFTHVSFQGLLALLEASNEKKYSGLVNESLQEIGDIKSTCNDPNGQKSHWTQILSKLKNARSMLGKPLIKRAWDAWWN
jgi:hypothetical protein